MKTKLLAVLVLSVAVILGAAAGGAGARSSGTVTKLQADLVLRSGVPRAGHPQVLENLYGGLDATWNSARSTFAYSLAWRGLRGTAFRVEIRSWSTGRTYAVLCAPCHAVPDRSAVPVSRVHGLVRLDSDAGYLIANGRTFVEVDTTAYPAGEIGGPIHPSVKYKGYGDVPRCC
jgi:hypothetical protein